VTVLRYPHDVDGDSASGAAAKVYQDADSGTLSKEGRFAEGRSMYKARAAHAAGIPQTIESPVNTHGLLVTRVSRSAPAAACYRMRLTVCRDGRVVARQSVSQAACRGLRHVHTVSAAMPARSGPWGSNTSPIRAGTHGMRVVKTAGTFCCVRRIAIRGQPTVMKLVQQRF
jgi:hypothetical protein